MNYTMHITEPGYWQVVEGNLKQVQSINYQNDNWLCVTSPCYVTVINGNIGNVKYIDTKIEPECVHLYVPYNGLIDNYDFCSKCGICKKEEGWRYNGQNPETD